MGDRHCHGLRCMISVGSSLKAALRSPLLPFWLVIALLPFGRSSELGTVLCLLGVILLFARHPHALQEHAGARLLLWLLAAYIGAALVSSFDSIVPGKSWSTVLALLRYVPLGLYACFAIRGEQKLHALYNGVALVIAFWTADAWVQTLTGWSLGGHADAERISGIFGATNLKLGPTLGVLSPFALWAASRRWGLPGLLLAFGFLLGPVLLAGSRAGWLCFGLVALAFVWREAKTPGRFLGLCAIGLVAVVLFVGIARQTSEGFRMRTDLTMVVLRGTSQSLDYASSGRLDIWRASTKMIDAHPFNGVGVRGFRYAYPHYAPTNDHFVTAESCGDGEGACHPHQLVLEILTETGVIGFLLWLAAAFIAICTWRRIGYAARAIAFPASVALGVMLFPLNTHLAFYSAWWGLLFGWLLGLWCAAMFVEPVSDEHFPPQDIAHVS
jgi:O-antigen ligase